MQFIECLVMNSIYMKSGILWNWYDIYKLIFDDKYAKTDKSNRKVVYSTSTTARPIGEKSYSTWNGLQIIDIDIKNKEIADKLKPIIFDELKTYNWFLGVCKSASQKSLHVWTKIQPISLTPENRKIEFFCNFRHKYSALYIILIKYINELCITKDDVMNYMDLAMGKPQQGIYITSDKGALLNTNFKNLRLDVNFETAFNGNISSINWISHPDLKEMFKKLEWFANDTQNNNEIDISNIININDRDVSKSLGPKHYKHNQRWQLANTLTYIFGEEKALNILTSICKDTPYQELKGDIKTAVVHSKPISIWAVKELNYQHGFKLRIKSNEVYNDNLGEEFKQINNKKENNEILDVAKEYTNLTNDIVFNIKSNQFLSDIKNDIINNLGKITLLEAGAGVGKTEMIKQLGKRTLLILPYTSIIKSKVEADEKIADWLYFYANKTPTIDDILGYRSLSMTVDKFSKLNIFELNASNIEYIVIDESHLLFMSQFRNVMSLCIQRLANCQKKVILMSGTPTGEKIFFPGIKHIKVIKEDYRKKEFMVNMCPTINEVIVEMTKDIADNIIAGKRILFPTNRGMLYYEEIVGLVQKWCDEKNFKRQIKTFYYKKSNTGEEIMEDIDRFKTIRDVDLICCSSFLSVGIDICDKYDFVVYFDKLLIYQDIEQYANRIRNNDLYIKMWLPREDKTGLPINYRFVKPLDLSFQQDELIKIRDYIKTFNDMIERNQDEYKQNPIIQYMISTNPYIKYDENDCRYYIDETQYKLMVYENSYKEYGEQLKVIHQGMVDYGYNVTYKEYKDRISDDKISEVEEYFKTLRRLKYVKDTAETFDLLAHLNDNNMDYYKNIVKGAYEMFRGDEYKIEREKNQIYANNIEILQKNIKPILHLYKYYDCDTIKKIFQYCVDTKQNRINRTKLDRIVKFANIEYNRRKKRLDFPVYKYIKEAQEWAKEHPTTTKEEIEKLIKQYTVKYANAIPDLVVEDIKFLESLYSTMTELWKVIIIQSRPSNNKIKISPFKLLWEHKIDLNNLYGGVDATKDFFLNDLMENMDDNKNDDDNEILPDYDKTSKLTIEDIKDEIPNIIHKDFDYYKYSEEDGSNDRFLRKQRNINKIDNINNVSNNNDLMNDLFNEEEKKKNNYMGDLFKDEKNEAPF